MTKTVPRYKEVNDLTTDELTQRMSAERQGKPTPKFETDAYKQARREALEDAGLLEVDDGDAQVPLEDLTPDEIYRRIHD